MENKISAGDIVRLRFKGSDEEQKHMLILAVSYEQNLAMAAVISAKSEKTNWVPRKISADGVEGSTSGLPCDSVVPAINPIRIAFNVIEVKVGSVSKEFVADVISDIKENQ